MMKTEDRSVTGLAFLYGETEMAKVLFMLGAFLLIGLTLLGLRVHRWEYARESALLAQEVRERSVPAIWGQEYEIAGQTNPVV